MKVARFARLSGLNLAPCAEALMAKILSSRNAYKRYALLENSIERLVQYIEHSMQKYWKARKKGTLHDRAFHTSLLLKLQTRDFAALNDPQAASY